MSKRRKPGEVVRRAAMSGFLSDGDPPTAAPFVRVPDMPEFETDSEPCDMGAATGCIDPACRQWANLTVVGGEFDGGTLCHISECQMEDGPTNA